MKWLKRFGIIIVLLPVIFIVICGVYETFGMCINHLATKEQTTTLQNNLQKEISDIEIVTEWDCYVDKTEEGTYMICISTSAPFVNNIEGH